MLWWVLKRNYPQNCPHYHRPHRKNNQKRRKIWKLVEKLNETDQKIIFLAYFSHSSSLSSWLLRSSFLRIHTAKSLKFLSVNLFAFIMPRASSCEVFLILSSHKITTTMCVYLLFYSLRCDICCRMALGYSSTSFI